MRALRQNHTAWALRSESLESSVLCIWRAGTVSRGSQGLRWEWGAGLDPFSPCCPGSPMPRPGQQPVTGTAWTTLCSWFWAQSKDLKPVFPGDLGPLHQLRALDSLILRLRVQRRAEFSLLTEEVG